MLLPESFEWMLKNLEVRTDYKGWGGKRCVRIQMGGVFNLVRKGLIEQAEWKPDAQAYVDDNAGIIFEERISKKPQYIGS